MTDPFGGIEPPTHLLNPISSQSECTETRICPECGVKHGWVVEETATGKILEKLDKCRGCLLGFGPNGHMKNWKPIQTQITLEDDIDWTTLKEQLNSSLRALQSPGELPS